MIGVGKPTARDLLHTFGVCGGSLLVDTRLLLELAYCTGRHIYDTFGSTSVVTKHIVLKQSRLECFIFAFGALREESAGW